MTFTRRTTRTQSYAARRRRLGPSHLLTPVIASLAALTRVLGGCAAASALVGTSDDTLIFGTSEVSLS